MEAASVGLHSIRGHAALLHALTCFCVSSAQHLLHRPDRCGAYSGFCPPVRQDTWKTAVFTSGLSQSAFLGLKSKWRFLTSFKKEIKEIKITVRILMRWTLFCRRLTFLSVKLYLYTPDLLAEIETARNLMILADQKSSSQLNKDHSHFVFFFLWVINWNLS